MPTPTGLPGYSLSAPKVKYDALTAASAPEKPAISRTVSVLARSGP